MSRSSTSSPTLEPGSSSFRLARHAVGFDALRLPAPVVHATKRAILDAIGVMLAASGECPEVRPFLELVRAQPMPPQATLLGFAERAGATQAALVNGALAHALDFEDAFDPVPLHPNASLIPAALAILEAAAAPGIRDSGDHRSTPDGARSIARPGRSLTGHGLIAAVALGCDLVCRLGLSLRRPLEAGGWYPPPILGAFGATLAAARLAGLEARQLCDAWSLLLAQNSCPGEIKHSPDTVLRAVREAFPAHAAVLSVQLAARGVRGFDAPLEGRAAFYQLFAGGEYDPAPLLDALGERFWISELSFKRWPCCRGTHAFIEAVQVLRREHALRPEQIERIVCVGGPVQRMLAEPPERKQAPRTVIDAKFSIPFTVALALTEPQITLGSFRPAALERPEILRLAARCDFQLRPEWGAEHAAAGEVIVRLRDGSILRHEVLRAIGDPSRPLTDADLREKFIDCASRAAHPIRRGRAAEFAARVMSLELAPDALGALPLA
jgi:2-methylcitrate dehydratase PrpD